MKTWKLHVILDSSTVKESLARLNEIGIANNVLFITDSEGHLLGSLTDGDIRRGLLSNAELNSNVKMIMNGQCKRISNREFDNNQLLQYRQMGIHNIPLINEDGVLVDVINLDDYKEIIPVDALIMAGGKGERLLPLTKSTPKPLLKVGDKPIIEHNIDRLIKFGIQYFHISVNYLANQICDYFGDGSEKGIVIKYLKETKPLGTLGAATLADKYIHEDILLMNSDLLTNIDFSDLYREYKESSADMAVASIPHHVDLPYGILELEDSNVTSLKEKPRYTYFANAGIYLFKKSLLNDLAIGEYFNATDLMERVISEKGKLIHFPVLGYWLDIGRMSDYEKAQEDIKHINW